jgi:hypothetical protein
MPPSARRGRTCRQRQAEKKPGGRGHRPPRRVPAVHHGPHEGDQPAHDEHRSDDARHQPRPHHTPHQRPGSPTQRRTARPPPGHEQPEGHAAGQRQRLIRVGRARRESPTAPTPRRTPRPPRRGPAGPGRQQSPGLRSARAMAPAPPSPGHRCAATHARSVAARSPSSTGRQCWPAATSPARIEQRDHRSRRRERHDEQRRLKPASRCGPADRSAGSGAPAPGSRPPSRSPSSCSSPSSPVGPTNPSSATKAPTRAARPQRRQAPPSPRARATGARSATGRAPRAGPARHTPGGAGAAYPAGAGA